MWIALLMLLLAAVASPCLAQDAPAAQGCLEKAQTQAEMNECAGRDANRTEAELNAVYKQLLAKAATGPKDAVAKIKAAERAWLAYRDAYMEAMFPAADKQAEYGSMYPMNFAMTKDRITGLQVQALRDILESYSEPK